MIPKRLDEWRAALEPQRVLKPEECGVIIPKGPWDRQKPTALGGELPSYGGFGRFFSESIDSGPGRVLSVAELDEYTIDFAPVRKRAKIDAACAMFAGQTLAWTRTLLEQLTQTEMEVTMARFRKSTRKLKIK